MFLQPDGDVFLSIVSTKYSWKFPPPKKDDSNDDDDIDDDNDDDDNYAYDGDNIVTQSWKFHQQESCCKTRASNCKE